MQTTQVEVAAPGKASLLGMKQTQPFPTLSKYVNLVLDKIWKENATFCQINIRLVHPL